MAQRSEIMTWLIARTKIVGTGIVLGALFSSWCATAQLPPTWEHSQRAIGWCWFMAGPFAAQAMGIPEISHPFVTKCVALGILAVPMIASHPVRPSPVTACLCLFGFLLWFAASYFTVICAVWGE